MSSESSDIFVEESNFEEERYCGALAVFGKALLENDSRAQYDKAYVDNFTGRTVGDSMELLASTGYLEKQYVASQDSYFFQLPDSKEIIDEAKEIAEYIDKNYEGKVFRFIDDFDEEDVRRLQHREVGLVYNL